MIELKNANCKECPFQQLEIITFDKDLVIKSCTKCNNN
jgi:hypothetical protein